MRAVNLIPKDYRRGALAGRGGERFSYMLIAGLAVLLVAMLSVILTNNSISGKKAEIADLKQQEIDAKAKADSLQAYSTFASLQQARTATVSSLAQSRFDWERVMRELSQVIPSDVSLTKLTGSVLPDVVVDNDAALTARDAVSGPALEIVGCAPGQEQVATFVAALEDIDGVTRVGVQSSDKPQEATGAAGAGAGTGDECRTTDSTAKFEIVVAFDAAPVPAAAGASPAPGAPTAPTPAPAGPAAPGDGGVGQGQQQQVNEQQNVQQGSDRAKKATKLVPGN
ncbi:MAG: PilN domain-containing protein [Solirubrobacterales bacterium]